MTTSKENISQRTVLAIVAHPDDEILGCAGTLMAYKQLGYRVEILILGEGETSRTETRQENISSQNSLKSQAQNALDIMGLAYIHFGNFYDNRFDHHDLLDIVKFIEEKISIIAPEIIFTHFKNDLNVDHQICYQAVLTATRPMTEQTVKEIYAFETLSATEWNFPLSFSPDFFVPIQEFLDLKCEAMNAYTSEIRDYPHPRSLKGIRLNAEYWGMRMGIEYAEAFQTIRRIFH